MAPKNIMIGKADSRTMAKSQPLKKAKNNPAAERESDLKVVPIFSPIAF